MQKERLEINCKVKRIGNSPYFKSDFHQNEKQTLEQIKGLTMLAPTLSNDDYSNLPDIVITNTHNKLSEENLSQFKNTKLIIHANSGYDNFEIGFVKNFKGHIVLGNEIRANAVATYILTSLFNHFSKIPFVNSWDKSRAFDRKRFDQLNILIIGKGQIGNKLLHSLAPLNSNLFCHDPFQGSNINTKEKFDVVIFACSYNQTNHHYFDSEFTKRLSEDALIINCARGELIQTEILVDFLDRTPKAFAILDVFEKEPNNFQQFKNITNISLSSHIAGVFTGIDEKTFEFETNVINDYFSLKDDSFINKYEKLILKNKINEDFLI